MLSVVKTGPEFRVDSPGHGSSACPAAAALVSGGFVVCWTENDQIVQHPGGPDIKARLYSSSGELAGPEFFVNRETFDYQQDPAVAGLLAGGFVAAWQDFSGRGGDNCGSSIKARLFGPQGDIIRNEFLVNQETLDNQLNPAVAALPHGGFVIAWQDFSRTAGDDSLACIKARLFSSDATPLGDEFLVNTHTKDNQLRPTVAALAGGEFVVVWNDFSGTLGDSYFGSIKAKVFGPDGEVMREELLVNSSKWNNQNLPAVAALERGGFVVAWTDASGSLGDHSSTSIKARLFDDLARPATAEFLVNSETHNTQIRPSIAALTDGGFAIAWTDYSGRGIDDSSSGIKGKLFSWQGDVVQDEFLINTETQGEQNNPTAIGLVDGCFAVFWQDHPHARSNTKLSLIKGQILSRNDGGALRNSQHLDDQMAGHVR